MSDILNAWLDRDHQRVKALLEKMSPEEINQNLEDGISNMHFAADQNQLDLLKLLYAQGGNINGIPKQAYSPFTVALMKGDAATVAWFQAQGATFPTKWHQAAYENNIADIKNLFASPTELAKYDACRLITPLVIAATQDHFELVQVILENLKKQKKSTDEHETLGFFLEKYPRVKGTSLERMAHLLLDHLSLNTYCQLTQNIKKLDEREENVDWLLDQAENKLANPAEKPELVNILLFELLLFCIQNKYLTQFKKLLGFAITKEIDIFSREKSECNLLDYTVMHHLDELVELLKIEYKKRKLDKKYKTFPFMNRLQEAIYNNQVGNITEQALKVKNKTDKRLLCPAAFSGNLKLMNALLMGIRRQELSDADAANLINSAVYVFHCGGKTEIVHAIFKKLPDAIADVEKEKLGIADIIASATTSPPTTQTTSNGHEKKAKKKKRNKKKNPLETSKDKTAEIAQAAHKDFEQALRCFKQNQHLEADQFLYEGYKKYEQIQNKFAMAIMASNQAAFAASALDAHGQLETSEHTLIPLYQNVYAHYAALDLEQLEGEKKRLATTALSEIGEKLNCLTMHYGKTPFWTEATQQQTNPEITRENNALNTQNHQ